MANKKKTTTKSKSNTKVNKKNVVKKSNVIINDNKEEESKKSTKELKELLIIILVITGAFLIVYFLTVGANKIGWFDEHYKKSEVEKPIINYEDIILGTMFNRSENDYYVVLSETKDKNVMYLNSLISSYREKENVLPLYFVDLSEGLNKSAVSSESNVNTSNVQELKINDVTLIHVKNGINVEAFVGIDNVASILR